MSDNDGSVNSRLEQSNYGTPKINPDEQRKYLGTFRERVSLAIPIKDLSNQYALKAFQIDLKAHPDYQLIVNGQVDQSQIGVYMKAANDNNVQFVVKNDSFYRNGPDDYGVIYAAKQAINQSPIDWNQKYPEETSSNNDDQNETNNKSSFWDKIKKIF